MSAIEVNGNGSEETEVVDDPQRTLRAAAPDIGSSATRLLLRLSLAHCSAVR